jgi:hypothetical protein
MSTLYVQGLGLGWLSNLWKEQETMLEIIRNLFIGKQNKKIPYWCRLQSLTHAYSELQVILFPHSDSYDCKFKQGNLCVLGRRTRMCLLGKGLQHFT